MRRNRALLRVGALGLVAAMAIGIAPMTAASAKTATGINRNSTFCKQLISQESTSEKYASKIDSELEANKLSAAKSTILSEFNFATKYVSEALTSSGVPSNIQSALKYFLTVYNTEKPGIRAAGSLSALEAALTSLSKLPKFTSANKTISAYVSLQCGSLTPSTTS
jgi:uncharacterized protein (UPF0147 family)